LNNAKPLDVSSGFFVFTIEQGSTEFVQLQ